MDKIVLGFIVIFTISNVQCITKEELEVKLGDVEILLTHDLYEDYVIEFIKNADKCLKPHSDIGRCLKGIERKLTTYVNPMMTAFVKVESAHIKNLHDEIESQYSADTALLLFEQIINLVKTIEKHFATFKSYMEEIME